MAQSHHVIPKTYQKGFVDPTTPEGQTPFVWVYKFDTQTWERRGPMNVAALPDYYALPGKEGKERYELEHEVLSSIEQRARGIYERKIARCLDLDAEEKEWYALFVALMMSRVPAFRERMNHLAAETVMLPIKLLRQNPELFERHMRAYERNTGNKPLTEEHLRLLDEGVIQIKASQDQHLQYMAYSLEVVMPLLIKMQWFFCHSTAPEWYITSDNPVTLRVLDHPEWGFGLARRDMQITFPVSREVGLWAMWGKGSDMHLSLPALLEAADGRRIELPKGFVRAANIQTMAYAKEALIASSSTFPGADVLPHKAALPAFFHEMAAGGDQSN